MYWIHVDFKIRYGKYTQAKGGVTRPGEKVRVRSARDANTVQSFKPPKFGLTFRSVHTIPHNIYEHGLTFSFLLFQFLINFPPQLTRSNGDLHCRDEAAISHIAIPYSLLVGFIGTRISTKPIFIPTNQATTTCEARLLL